jgi:predicted histone-like DNA-binding protein
MKIKLHIIRRKDPRDQNLPEKYYANQFDRQAMEENELIKLVSLSSSVSEGDVYAVLKEISLLIKMNLQRGRTVKIPFLGYVYVNINSRGEATPDEVSDKSIRKVNARMRLSRDLMKAVRDIRFKLIKKDRLTVKKNTSENPKKK